MMQNRRGWPLAILLVCSGIMVCGATDRQTRDALKVSRILASVAKKSPAEDGKLRSATISQRELDAYIAWRLAQEPDSGIHSLRIELLNNNHVAGTIRFDAPRLNLDKLLGETLDFDFKGIVYTRDRMARLDLISLALAGYPVKPQVLDYVLEFAARCQGSESEGLDGGYPLPKGVDGLRITEDTLVLFY